MGVIVSDQLIHTPELDKERQARIEGHSFAIGEFLEWLESARGYVLCVNEKNGYWPAGVTIEQLLADYFGIDKEQVEAERRAILAALRKEGP